MACSFSAAFASGCDSIYSGGVILTFALELIKFGQEFDIDGYMCEVACMLRVAGLTGLEVVGPGIGCFSVWPV